MPYYKCCSCHHEWERIPENKYVNVLCDWCGSPSYILEEKTPLEKMVDDIEKAGGFEKWLEIGRKI